MMLKMPIYTFFIHPISSQKLMRKFKPGSIYTLYSLLYEPFCIRLSVSVRPQSDASKNMFERKSYNKRIFFTRRRTEVKKENLALKMVARQCEPNGTYDETIRVRYLRNHGSWLRDDSKETCFLCGAQ